MKTWNSNEDTAWAFWDIFTSKSCSTICETTRQQCHQHQHGKVLRIYFKKVNKKCAVDFMQSACNWGFLSIFRNIKIFLIHHLMTSQSILSTWGASRSKANAWKNSSNLPTSNDRPYIWRRLYWFLTWA